MDSFFVDLDEHFVSLSLRTVYYESSLRRVEPRAFVVVEYREAVHRYCLDRWLCFCFACRFCKRSGDSIAQHVRGHGLSHEVSCAELHRVDCKFDRCVSSSHDHTCISLELFQLTQGFQTIHSRHSLVQNYRVPLRAIAEESQPF